jgi:hypothetical protein
MAAEDAHIISSPQSDDDSIDGSIPLEPNSSDPNYKYILEARERIAQHTAKRLVDETKSSSSPSKTEIATELIIESRAEGIPVVRVKLHISKPMKEIKEAWILKNMQRSVPFSRSRMEDMFFTWKGHKIYDGTTLSSLGINPDSKGHLFPKWETSKEGFMDIDKVHFEAWTTEDFEQYEKDLNVERARKRGEIVDLDEDESEPEPEPTRKEARIRVILRSKDDEQNLKVPPDCKVANLVKAFRSQKKIPDDKEIEVQFDGDRMDMEETIDKYGVEDMETVDVFIK